MAVLYDRHTPIEQVMYSEFVKYTELDQIIKKEYKTNTFDKTINVYIDLYQFLITLFRFTYIKNPYVISSCILNYCGHIRRYFRTRCNVYANVILVYSTTDSENILKFNELYNSGYRLRAQSNKKILEAVEQNMKLLKILIPYIPNVFLKCSTVEVSVMIYNMIKKQQIGVHPNLVISKSQMMYSLPAEFKSVVVIRKNIFPRLHYNTTYSYNSSNCLNYYIYELRKKLFVNKFNQRSVCFLMGLIGIPGRSIKSICSTNTALKILDLMPIGCEHDIETWTSIYMEYYKNKSRFSKEYLNSRFKCIDLLYQYKLYSILPDADNTDFLNQLEDKDSVQYINNYYFKDAPISLEDF